MVEGNKDIVAISRSDLERIKTGHYERGYRDAECYKQKYEALKTLLKSALDLVER